MSYQVIARKWRPQTFDEVTGQEAITRTLRNAIEHDRLHHAYIFSGSRGVGKTTTARLLAKSLNCHNSDKPNPKPCSLNSADLCVSCREISESRSIDVFEFDAASHTGVDDIRELILESININPARDRFKIFIIDEVHMLSKSSFNALLKTLEEPPPRVKFIMATTELYKLPDTIVSRCQEFEFRSIALDKIFARLRTIADSEEIEITDEALREIARSGEGSMRDAQSNFDQVISFSGEKIETDNVVAALGLASAEMLTATIRAIAANKPIQLLAMVDDLITRGQDLRNFCRDLLSFFRDLLVVKLGGASENLLDTAVLSSEELEQAARPFSNSDLIRFFNSLSETETKLRDPRQPRQLLEIGLVKLTEMRQVLPVEDLVKRLADLEKSLADDGLEDNERPVKTPEKKTTTIEIPEAEVPFPVSAIDKNTEVPDDTPDEINSSTQLAEPFDGLDPPPRKTESDFIEDFQINFVDKLPVDQSTITSEELEHIEDKWLDAAYENQLLLTGDDLLVIPAASKLVSEVIGDQKAAPESESKTITHSAVNDLPELMPRYSDEDSAAVEMELSADPDEEEMRRYAENHPVVKKALRIFRGKITSVKKL